MLDSIVTNIQYRLAQQGLSAYALEKKINLKGNLLQGILAGTRKNPTLETLETIASGLNCSLSELVTKEPTPGEYHWHPEVFRLMADAITKNLKPREKINLRGLVDCLKAIYDYCEKDPQPKNDAKFIQWFIEENKEILAPPSKR